MATNKNFEVKNGLSVGGTERISSAGVFDGSLASGVTATTQSAADSSTKIATTAYTDAAITALIGGAPSALNDLNELAAAIADDANYSTTLTTALATKLPLAGGTMTGNISITKEDPFLILTDSSSSRTLMAFNDNNNSVVRASGPLLLQVGSQSAITIDASRNTTLAGTLASGAITSSGTSTFADVTIGGTGDSQSLIQMFANSTNGANTIHFGDATSGTASYTGYINYAHDTNRMQFATNGGIVRLTIDNSGNVGIGLTPTNFSSRKSLDIGLGGKIWGHTSATETGIGSNFYFDGAYKRTSANAATRHIQDGNGHTFDVAASGSADATISWLNALSIDSSGNTVFNSGGVDQDFTIKSNNSSTALYIDGANDYISFGNNAVNLASGYADQSGVGIHCLDGYMQISADSTPLTTGRTSTAGRGRHIIMRNASSVVGSIGDYNGVPYIGYDTAAGGGIMFNGTAVEPMGLAGARQTNINDLGSSNYRWKDGYFSNAVQAKSFERLWNFLDLTALDMGYFYPVGLNGGSASVLQSFELFKYYGNYNPSVGGVVQHGACSLKLEIAGYSWGGNVIHNYLDHVASTYRCMVGAVTLRGYYVPVIWLRGGYGYHWTSNNPNITATVYSTNTSFYDNTAYVYTVGRITDSVMQGKSGYLGTVHKYGIVAEDTSCNNWYT